MDARKLTVNEALDIRETVDGVPVEEAQTASSRPQKPAMPEEASLKRGSDGWLWGLYIVLILFSIVEVYSASSTQVTSDSLYGPLLSHVKFLVLGLGIMVLFQRTHYRVFRRWAWVAAILCGGLVLMSNYIGVNINNAQRAIELPGGLTIQPPEIAKLAVVLVLARIMAKHQKSGGVTTKGVVQSAVVVAVYAGLLYENGLTNTIILMAVSISMFVIGGIEWKKLFVVLAVYVCLGGLLYSMKYVGNNDDINEFEQVSSGGESGQPKEVDRTATHKSRFASYFEGVKPTDPVTDENRQVRYSNMAMAHGGLTGHGPGFSRESARLPLAYSDYIFSIIVEDVGFVGGTFLLFIFMMFPLRSGAIAGRCSRAFPALLIMGCSVLILLQALIHMAIATGLGPVSGQPLPFISRGGTSIIVMSAALGMMLSVSRYAVRNGNKKDINRELRELPEDIRSGNPMQLEIKKRK